jgi:hypothetical protein
MLKKFISNTETKTLLLILTISFLASTAFAQRANKQWGNENVQTISGIIYDNSRPTSYIKTDDGTYYKIHLGPIWYWNDNNYNLLLSFAKIKGNVKTINGEYHLYPFTIEQDGNKIILADDNGVPKWGNCKGRNNGTQNGNGHGRGNGNCCRNGNGNGWGNCLRNK